MEYNLIAEDIVMNANKITAECFNWCKEQNFVYQNNLEIHELSFIVIALIAIVVHNTLNAYWDYFRNQEFDEDFLEKIYDASSFVVFVMLIMFLIYMVWLR